MTSIIWYILSTVLLSYITFKSRKALNELAYLLFRSKTMGVSMYSLLYFPGTVLHEISHFLFAAFLGVRTGQITLFPERDDDENRVRLGSVQIAKTDFFRSSLIGAAPFITGTIALVYFTSTFGWLEISNFSQIVPILQTNMNEKLFWLKMYAILAVSNTLFTSKEDRRHWPVFIVIALIVIASIYIINPNVFSNSTFIEKIENSFFSGSLAFFFSTVVNVVLLTGIKVLIEVIQKITKTKIIYKS